ncbi:MAG: RICIN domain-containing protein [Hyphomonadaceae bacterium]|nr:RICIN domain-containing protein [Hyphomonadaceae bacterium]
MFKGWLCGIIVCVALAAPAEAQTLEPARLPGLCLTITGEGSVSRPCDKSPGQTFELPGDAPGPIRFGDLCLAPRGNANHYPQLFPETCDGSPAQTWTISAGGAVRNGDGRCLSLLGLSAISGTRIYASVCPTRVEPQAWVAKPVDQEIYDQVSGRLRWRARPELCLSYIGDGSYIGLEPCGENLRSEQVFAFDRGDPGQFRGFGGTCLTSSAMTQSIVLRRCAVSPTTTWMLQDHSLLSNGEARCAAPMLEDERWVVRISRCAATIEQSWTFEPAIATH